MDERPTCPEHPWWDSMRWDPDACEWFCLRCEADDRALAEAGL